MTGNRNQLEERRARYGPNAVPLEVVNALAEVIDEITGREAEIRTVKAELARLSRPQRGSVSAPDDH